VVEHLGCGAHQRQELARVEEAKEAEWNGDEEAEGDRLDRRVRGAVGVPLADPRATVAIAPTLRPMAIA
jgi:hypothetical protein